MSAANGSVSSQSFNCSHSKLQSLADGSAKEYLWGCELTAEKPAVTWTFEEEDDDQEFLNHTLFLRHAVLGADVKEERHLIQVETTDHNGDDLKQPLGSLKLGQNDMCTFDLNFSHEIPVTFRLIAGSGPVYLSAQQLVEFPSDQLPEDDDECSDDLETEGEESMIKESKAKKRKGPATKANKRKVKVDSSAENGSEEDDEDLDEEEEDEDDEDHDEDMDEDEDDEAEESPSPKKKSKKEPVKKAEPAKGKKGAKAESKSKEAAKAPAKKAKKGKAK